MYEKAPDSDPYPPLQYPVVLPTVPWEPLEVLINVSEIKKNLARQRLDLGHVVSEPCCPNRFAVIYFSIGRFCNFIPKKKENDSTE